jgi:8-oxo-dGTP diphosphatase
MIVVAAAIVRDRCLLAQQRAFPAHSQGRWELPGGRVEDGESERDALRRECYEELGVRIDVADRLGPDVVLGHSSRLRVFAATLGADQPEPRPVEHRALRWVRAGELAELNWLSADLELLPALRQLLDAE